MRAVLESPSTSPVAQARAALEVAQHDLVQLDTRIRGYERELEERDKARREWRMADT